MNILFICTGNVSRSFLAEMLMKNEIRRHNWDHISVSSAGLYAYPGSLPDPVMVDYLLQAGVPVGNHNAKQMTKTDMDWADLILVMERGHEKMIGRLWPQARAKTALLGTYLSKDPDTEEISDPFGGSTRQYRLAQARIRQAIENLVRRLIQIQTREQDIENQDPRR